MRFIKLGHSCVRLEKDGAALVIDPGTFSDAPAALDGAAAVLVTHEHPDHLDADAIRAALSRDPGVTLWANQSICAQFAEFGDRVHEVKHGDALEVAGFDVHVYGVDHALIHPDIPLVVNTGFLVDGKNYAVLATVNSDGSPQTSVVWVGRDGGDLLFSTVEGRVKHRNMARDPRVSVSIIDSADPENYVELRGRVSMTPDVGRAVDTQLSWKYDGRDPGEDRPGAVRVVVRMEVQKATGYGA